MEFKQYKSSEERFRSDEAWGTSPIKIDHVDWDKLEVWAKENLVCIVCGRRVPMGDRAKMHLQLADDGEVEVRIAHFPCLGREADGVTPYKRKLYYPVGRSLKQ